jgi:predicted amidohydrolase
MATTTTARAARIAVCQLRSTNHLEANFIQCEQLIRKAASLGAQLVCLPENFSFLGTSYLESLAIAQPLSGARMDQFRGLARDNNIWLSLGGFQEKVEPADENAQPRLHNTHVIVDNSGSIRAVYRKLHLFDVDIVNGPKLLESSFTSPGSRVVLCESPVGKLGLSICYDVRFPELYLSLTAAGANVILVPAAFTVSIPPTLPSDSNGTAETDEISFLQNMSFIRAAMLPQTSSPVHITGSHWQCPLAYPPSCAGD